jgi:dihydroorotate dehydrogenase electron transfer subunit
MKLLKGEIISNEKYSDNLFKISVFSPYICKESQPGQFVNVRCAYPGTLDPLLRRPFGIFDIEKKFNVFSILYRVRGKGTRFLSDLRKGDMIDFVGPLGNGIDLDSAGDNILLIGGGIGIAPLYLLARESAKMQKNVFFAAGFRNKDYLRWEEDLIELKINYAVFTEDGSWGEKGLVSDYIWNNLKLFKDYEVYCCGPVGLLKELKKNYMGTDNKITALLEEMIACGIGVCNGCVIKVKKGKRGFSYKKVCKDGPAFDLREVIFD